MHFVSPAHASVIIFLAATCSAVATGHSHTWSSEQRRYVSADAEHVGGGEAQEARLRNAAPTAQKKARGSGVVIPH